MCIISFVPEYFKIEVSACLKEDGFTSYGERKKQFASIYYQEISYGFFFLSKHNESSFLGKFFISL